MDFSEYGRFWQWLESLHFAHFRYYMVIPGHVSVAPLAPWIVAVIICSVVTARHRSGQSRQTSRLAVNPIPDPARLAYRRGTYAIQWLEIGPDNNQIWFSPLAADDSEAVHQRPAKKPLWTAAATNVTWLYVALASSFIVILAADSQVSIHQWLQPPVHGLILLVILTIVLWGCMLQLLWYRDYSHHQLPSALNDQQTRAAAIIIRQESRDDHTAITPLDERGLG